jgi:hypothetical protein
MRGMFSPATSRAPQGDGRAGREGLGKVRYAARLFNSACYVTPQTQRLVAPSRPHAQ